VEILDTLASLVGGTWADVKPFLLYYTWLVFPGLVALVVMTVAVLKVLPRQRRREDLSGEDHRVR
jgi:hypothetical protein